MMKIANVVWVGLVATLASWGVLAFSLLRYNNYGIVLLSLVLIFVLWLAYTVKNWRQYKAEVVWALLWGALMLGPLWMFCSLLISCFGYGACP